jgi:hypothetical protein
VENLLVRIDPAFLAEGQRRIDASIKEDVRKPVQIAA